MGKVILAENPLVSEYPDSDDFFSPSNLHPEYPWNEATLSKKKNEVYELVRRCFVMASGDMEHQGTREWNPLKDVIKPGDVVLIKPNWVEHKNSNEAVDDNLACLVTNPSVVRAIVDYVAIALRGSGKIIIGDAPMQGCDLEELFRITGYDKLFEFYRQQGLELEIADMRKYSVSKVYKGVLSKPKEVENSKGSYVVCLDGASLHSEKDNMVPKYKVSDYRLQDTACYHQQGKHSYEVNKIPLLADVVINVPKPKTHRLAGMTGACKNLVGITYEKACLPHRTIGAVSEGGDEYLKKSTWKAIMQKFDEKATGYAISGKYRKAKICNMCMKVCYALGSMTSGDKYRIGSWYGNDTIWRTSIDLNYLLLYADKQGMIQETRQRKVLTIADMIICGQESGPVAPIPKLLGMIMISDHTLLFDRVLCEIMGFDRKRLPMLNDEQSLRKLGYDFKSMEEEYVYRDNGRIEKIKDFVSSESWRFIPHPCWKGHIEKKN